jgi:hypothetical protein
VKEPPDAPMQIFITYSHTLDEINEFYFLSRPFHNLLRNKATPVVIICTVVSERR